MEEFCVGAAGAAACIFENCCGKGSVATGFIDDCVNVLEDANAFWDCEKALDDGAKELCCGVPPFIYGV